MFRCKVRQFQREPTRYVLVQSEAIPIRAHKMCFGAEAIPIMLRCVLVQKQAIPMRAHKMCFGAK